VPRVGAGGGIVAQHLASPTLQTLGMGNTRRPSISPPRPQTPHWCKLKTIHLVDGTLYSDSKVVEGRNPATLTNSLIRSCYRFVRLLVQLAGDLCDFLLGIGIRLASVGK
jgi:hypothetical protein